MTEPKGVTPKLVIKRRPTIFIARNKKVTLLPGRPLDRAKKCLEIPAYSEQIIYSTVNISENVRIGDFRSLVLKNQLYTASNNSRTVASIVTHDNKSIEKTSDKITKIIGEKNYDNVFVALCSVINQELKVQAMLALLAEDAPDSQIKTSQGEPKSYKDVSCQTDEISKDVFYSKNVGPKRRIRLRCEVGGIPIITTEVQKSSPKRVLIHPCNEVHHIQHTITDRKDTIKAHSLPDLNDTPFNKDRNLSDLSSVSSDILNSKATSPDSVTENSIKKENVIDEIPINEVKSISNDREKCNRTIIETLDGSKIWVPLKPDDEFHLATPEILKHVTSEERKKLLWHQAYIDWKLCLERDEDGNT